MCEIVWQITTFFGRRAIQSLFPRDQMGVCERARYRAMSGASSKAKPPERLAQSEYPAAITQNSAELVSSTVLWPSAPRIGGHEVCIRLAEAGSNARNALGLQPTGCCRGPVVWAESVSKRVNARVHPPDVVISWAESTHEVARTEFGMVERNAPVRPARDSSCAIWLLLLTTMG